MGQELSLPLGVSSLSLNYRIEEYKLQGSVSHDRISALSTGYVEWSRWSKLNNKVLPGCPDLCYTTVPCKSLKN